MLRSTTSTIWRATGLLSALVWSIACSSPPADVDRGPADSSVTVDQGREAHPEDGLRLDEATPICSPAAPNGRCPSDRICVRGGGCVVDLDPRVPADQKTALELFEEVWTFYDQSYGAFPAKAVDWSAVRSTYRPLIEGATTKFEVSWLISQMVDAIEDGHTAAYDKERCAKTSYFGLTFSNVGACVTDVKGKLVVYRASPANASGFRLGDELESIDGRDVPAMLLDQRLQPACYAAASTEAMRHAEAVDGLLFRSSKDQSARVRRGGQKLELQLAPSSKDQDLLECDGRIGLSQTTGHAFGIESKLLAGDVLYLYLPMFGGYDSKQTFVDDPVIEVLRQIFTESAGKKGVVLDLRSNPGGSPKVYMALASWLFAKPTTLFYCRSKTGTGHTDHGLAWNMTSIPDSSLQYAGPLAVLVNARNTSCADFTSAWLHQTGRAKTFGAPTGGAFGNGSVQELNATWTLGYNDILCSGLDGELLEGNPPPVDFPLEYALEDLVQGKDTVIEAARAWVVKQ